jgi:hypothetical protein
MRALVSCIALAALLALGSGASRAATITIVNLDGVGEGFNDPTPVAPVGGNPGTTRGAQRLNVFQHAASIWGAILPSAVEIRVEARFNPLTCGATSGVLGSASPISAESGFPNAPLASTWYVIALVNKLAGVDRDPANNDITATFNTALDDDPNCLSGADWYYGYDGNEGSNVDLLPVVLHELGHGLGFLTLTNLSTGGFFSGLADVYARHILDNSSGKHWDAMTNGERAASALNTGNLVWDGPAVNAASSSVLGPTPVLVVTAPGSIAGTYDVGTASFGPQLTVGGVSGQVVLADDGVAPTSDACSALVNGAAMNGKIALIDRGTCAFVSKTQAAEAAGAIGVIIINNVAGAAPGMSGTDPGLGIPTVSVSQTDGNAIRAELGNNVTVTLKLDTTRRAGADAQGHVKLYAPNPLEQGSSVSHWDVSATPNLLMEPAINRDLQPGNVDLTFQHFTDIGWSPVTPVVLSDFEAAAASQEGVELRWRVADGEFVSFDVLRSKVHPGTTPFTLLNADQPVPGDGPWGFVDRDVEAGATYAYRIVGKVADGTFVTAGPLLVTIETPVRSALLVWPNPVRDTATLRFDLPRSGHARLQIFDLAGRRIRTWTESGTAPGRFTAHWDGRDDAGRRVASGIYVARLETSTGTVARRIAVLR